MAFLPPTPRSNNDLASHEWQDWFFKLQQILKTVENSSGHLYITNGARHAMGQAAGIKTSTTTVANTVTETTLFSYTFAANEIDADQHIKTSASGVVSNASAADDYTIRFKIGGATIHTLSRVGGNVTNVGWRSIFEFTTRSTGASGTYVDFTQHMEDTLSYTSSDATTHSIDTTVSNLFEITVQWAAAKAGNTISCTQGIVEFDH